MKIIKCCGNDSILIHKIQSGNVEVRCKECGIYGIGLSVENAIFEFNYNVNLKMEADDE